VNGLLNPSTTFGTLGAARAQRPTPAVRAPNTRRAYLSSWEDFAGWCADNRVDSLPALPETVCRYLSYLADQRDDDEHPPKMATIRARVPAIRDAHEKVGITTPTDHLIVRNTLKQIAADIGSRSTAKRALPTNDVQRMVRASSRETARGVRDRAILLLGASSGLRRETLVALNVGDIEELDEGLRVTIAREKTDQEGHGRVVGIPLGKSTEFCPVGAVRDWLAISGPHTPSSPLLRTIASRSDKIHDGRMSDRAVARTVQRVAAKVGLNANEYGAHSMRSGLVTSAKRGDADDQVVMRQTGHRTRAMIDHYTQEDDLFRDNAARRAGW
jgi:integrase